ncbi:MAG: PKD domain-containing protein [Aggregatilineales bacterium]
MKAGRPFFAVFLIVMLAFLSACNLGAAEPTVAPTTSPTRTPSPTPSITPTVRIPTQIPTLGAIFPTLRPTNIVVVPTSPPPPVVPTTPPLPIRIAILSPVPGSVIAGSTSVLGSAVHPNFLQYHIEYGPDPNPGNLWYPVESFRFTPVSDGVLGNWNTLGIPDGTYQLRLRVFLRDGTILSTSVGNIRVRNTAPTPVPSATPATPRPTAAFTFDRASGDAPLTVQFSNQSFGVINSFQWSFGDGGTSTQPNPSHTYTRPGLYTVTLTVSGPGGTSNVSAQINVRTPAAPTAAFTPSVTSGTSPLTVSFRNDSLGNITSYFWNFGDGTTSTERNPTKTFIGIGTYNVFLTVTGPGGTSIASRQITVQSPVIPPPTASFTYNPISGQAPLSVTFTNRSSGDIQSQTWNFGDGTISTLENPVHTYQFPGIYTVTLVVTGRGGQNTAQASVVVVAPPTPTPTLTPIPPTATYTNTAIPPMDTATHTPIATAQILTDTPVPTATFTETPTETLIPTATFTETPTETLIPTATFTETPLPLPTATETLIPTATFTETPLPLPTATDTLVPTATFTETPTDTPIPTATFTETPTETPAPTNTPVPPPVPLFTWARVPGAPLTVQFTNQSSGIIEGYLWEFGDGGLASDANPTHTYAAGGTFTVRLSAFGPGGTVSYTADVVLVAAGFTFSPVPGSPQTIAFTSTASGPVVSYQWDFGDGSGAFEPNPTHTFAPGTFTVTLTVTAADGSSDSASQSVTIAEPVSAGFTFSPVPGSPQTIAFTSTASGPVVSYQWDFGDGSVAFEPNPTHTFAPGTFTVTLTVTAADGSSDSASQTITVEPLPVPTPPIIELPQPITTLTAPGEEFSALDWDPNGNRLISGTFDGEVTIWDLNTRQPVRSLTGLNSAVWSVAWSPAGNRVAAAGDDGVILIWETDSWQNIAVLQVGSIVNAIDWNSQGTQFASGDASARVILWSIDAQEPVTIFQANTGINALSWHPNGTRLASVGNDGNIVFWDLNAGTFVGNIQVGDVVNALSYHPDGSRIAAAAANSVIIYDVNSGQPLRNLSAHAGTVIALAYHPNGSVLATGGADAQVILWDGMSGEQRLTLQGHTAAVTGLAWNADSSRLASAGEDGLINIWQP